MNGENFYFYILMVDVYFLFMVFNKIFFKIKIISEFLIVDLIKYVLFVFLFYFFYIYFFNNCYFLVEYLMIINN